MTAFLRSDRSRPVALWLLVVAVLVLAMVVVGGSTRLTGSGLSITQWRPVSGVLPPMSTADWQAEFSRYRAIPQFRFVNPSMTLDQFRFIYWWEWSHRFLARLLGMVFLAPFAWFALRRELPRRLRAPFAVVVALLALEPLVGWWMVASGLAQRVYVAPERLMIHLGIAFALLAALVWTALEAMSGVSHRTTRHGAWFRVAVALTALIYAQILLGALVAGNRAGLVYNDWPLFAGRLFPPDYAAPGLWATLAHSQAAVQLNHRMVAYLLLAAALAVGVGAWRSRDLPHDSRTLAVGVSALVLVQAILGVATLMLRVPLALGVAHQLTAALTLSLAVVFAWRVRRP